MLSRSGPGPIRPSSRRAACRLASLIACALTISSCAAGASSVDREATAPRLAMPPQARQACSLSTLEGEAWADAAVLARMRGADVLECDGRRRLAVDTHDEEHRLEAEHEAMRWERNRSLWQRITPWREP